MFNSRSESDFDLTSRQVYCVNNVGGEDALLLMSLIYIRNNSGSNVDPCGTPDAMCLVVDVILLSATYCFFICKV